MILLLAFIQSDSVGSAERLGPASLQTSTSGTWIWLCSTIWTADAWRDGLTLWQGAQLAIDTTLVSVVVTGLPGQELLTMTGPHSRKLVVEKSARTTVRGRGEGLAWSFLPQRLEASGASKLHSSWSAWKAKADAAPDVSSQSRGDLFGDRGGA